MFPSKPSMVKYVNVFGVKVLRLRVPPIWPILNWKSNPRSLLARRAIRQNGGSPDPQQPVEAWLLMMEHQYTIYEYWGMVINPLIGIYKPILKI